MVRTGILAICGKIYPTKLLLFILSSSLSRLPPIRFFPGVVMPGFVRSIHLQLFLPRYSVFACFGGGILHMLEGWTHHEVGPIDVDRMDTVWEAAMRQGFRPVV